MKVIGSYVKRNWWKAGEFNKQGDKVRTLICN